ncbi:MAG: tRNA (guanosine(37)-N1)-methyltransferase TrmD [Nitriliruptoraceae bacterium]
MVGPRIDVLTIFPDWFAGPLDASLLGRARADGRLDIRVHDLRDWAAGVHRSVDDAPYGGGAGMVMRPDVLIAAAESVWNDLPPAAFANDPDPDAAYIAGGHRPPTILLTPRGRPFTQERARQLAALERFVLVCGRYEGIDERAHELVATEEISIGDYVLFGGEVAAAVVIEAVTRLVDGIVGNAASPQDESFAAGLLEYPHYTRPPTVRGLGVPDVLTSGDHDAVDQWRRARARAITAGRRPDLLNDPDLLDDEE